jgi:hypothetical protein
VYIRVLLLVTSGKVEFVLVPSSLFIAPVDAPWYFFASGMRFSSDLYADSMNNSAGSCLSAPVSKTFSLVILTFQNNELRFPL